MISIIIPTYNHARELDYCLDSIRNQDYQDFEIIVVDDGSVDHPEDVVKNYSNLQFYRQPNMGAPAARNKGFELAQGDEVIFLDADVVMRPDMLGRMHRQLSADTSISFVYSAFKIGRKTMRYVPFSVEKLRKFNYIHSSSLVRARDFPGWDESLKKFQDWDLWLTMIERGLHGVGVDEILFKIVNPGSGTMSQWLPRLAYVLPWPLLNYTPRAIAEYVQARKIILEKHGLLDREEEPH